MEPAGSPARLSDADAASLLALCDVASANGSALSLRDALLLTTIGATEEDLVAAWRDTDSLRSSGYEPRSGLIISKDADQGEEAARRSERSTRSSANLESARWFSSLLKGGRVKLIAVSGSTSYRSAGRADDIDLFCVTETASLWPFMLKALLLSRFSRLARRALPPFCLSCVMDEAEAAREFGAPRDRIFARDALTTEVIQGSPFYEGLLESGVWMEGYFPRLYGLRLRQGGGRRDARDQPGKSTHSRAVLNSYLYCLVGGYLRLKARLLNMRLAREGRYASMFRVRIGRDRCVYESRRYERMRAMYSADGDAPE